MSKITQHKLFIIVLLITLILTLTVINILQSTEENPKITSPDPALTITAKTNKPTYLLRQKVKIEGNITQDGNPATDLVVLMQITNPRNQPVAYRTLTHGNPTQTWSLNITEIFLLDMSNKPINTARIGTLIQVGIKIHNPQATSRETYATITVYDANNVPLQIGLWMLTINPQSTVPLRTSVYIPTWACTGKALICANAYTKEPKEGGIALAPEKTAYFCISKTQQALIEYPSLPPPPPQNTPGEYQTQITLPPDPQAGTYTIYASAQASPTLKSPLSTATFTVENSQGYPPQASFAYWPAKPYENQTVEFDASSSTPEGFNDTITSYTWNFGDGTPPITEADPYITHAYLNAGTYTVTLNVTDNEGFWSATSKPITIYPEFGPTANFTWAPTTPNINQTITFNASNSTLGWSKTRGDFSPITNYAWNFSDGTGIINIATPTITHNYTQPGNYTVTLKITDADGRTAQTSAIVEVLNVTAKDCDIDGNGIIDLRDILEVKKGFGAILITDPNDPKYGQYWHSTPCPYCPHTPKCDVDKDGKIDLKDILAVKSKYGQDP
ncbi:MAG: PKD domain-containing protein [Candidatus Bathyarchaeia archaeon]